MNKIGGRRKRRQPIDFTFGPLECGVLVFPTSARAIRRSIGRTAQVIGARACLPCCNIRGIGRARWSPLGTRPRECTAPLSGAFLPCCNIRGIGRNPPEPARNPPQKTHRAAARSVFPLLQRSWSPRNPLWSPPVLLQVMGASANCLPALFSI